MMYKHIFIVVFSWITLLSCDRDSFELKNNTDAENLFSIIHNDGKKILGINKKQIDTEFLLRSNLIEGGESPTFSSLKTRIVLFDRVDNEIIMKESQNGHVYHYDIPQSFVLANFEIKHETKDFIFIDFNEGWKKIFLMKDWYAHDFSGTNHEDIAHQHNSLSLRNSHISSINTVGDASVQISQVGQVIEDSTSTPVELKYLLQKYNSNPNFKSSDSDLNNHFGFFEVAPQISHRENKDLLLASKFDISKPIVFAISHNTPEEYKAAIKEGILYWNKAFLKEVISVIDAPEGVTAPSYEYNIVQWVDWKNAGYAYADAQMDPRTGEILNAQIYMTSSFAISSLNRAQELFLKSTKNTSEYKFNHELLNNPEEILKVKDFSSLIEKNHSHDKAGHSNHLCQFSSLNFFLGAMEKLIESGAKDSDFLRVSQHYIRDVVSHEIGHTLGLRHNFAGSLETKATKEDKKTYFDNILKNNEEKAESQITSSVMDYLIFEDSVISGFQILNNDKAFEYDELAIQKLYFHKENKSFLKYPMFCTDSHLSKYSDCGVFRYDDHPLSHTQQQLTKNTENLPKNLFDTVIYLSTKDDLFDLKNLDLTKICTMSLAFNLLSPRFIGLNSLRQNASSLQLENNSEMQFTSFDENQRKQHYRSWILEKVKEGSSWKSLLDYNTEKSFEKIREYFTSHINSEYLEKYNLSEERLNLILNHKEDILNKLEPFLSSLQESILKIDILQLLFTFDISVSSGPDGEKSISDSFSSYIYEKAKNILTSRKAVKDIKGLFEFKQLIPDVIANYLEDSDKDIYVEVPEETRVNYQQAKSLAENKFQELIMESLGSLSQEEAMRLMFSLSGKPGGQKNLTKEELLASSKSFSVFVPVDYYLSDFKYSNYLRMLSTFLVYPYHNHDFDFALKERSRLVKNFEHILKHDLEDTPLKEIELEYQPQEFVRWLDINKKLYLLLLGKKEGSE